MRHHRLQVGLSQARLARRAGVDPAYVNRVEKARGPKAPSREVVLHFAEVLELSPRQTDRLLFAAGLAPVTDWQQRAEDYAQRLAGIVESLDGLALPDRVETQPFVRRAS